MLTGREAPEGRREGEALEGLATVHDPRVDVLAEIANPQKIKYAETTFLLCPDISEGSTSRFWQESARKCELLCMLVRSFKDDSVYHPDGSVDPGRDLSSLETELFLADLEMIENRLLRMEKEKKAGQTQAQALEEKVLVKCRIAIENESRDVGLTMHEEDAIKSMGLFILKPILWAYNVAEDELAESSDKNLRIACKIEQEIMQIEDLEERKDYLLELGLTDSGVDRMNAAAYKALGLMSFYTMGSDEVRAWTIRMGASAPESAGKIHSDIERGFIRAEVTKFDDLVAAGNEKAVKESGKVQLKGKDYIIEDGDICNFLFNV